MCGLLGLIDPNSALTSAQKSYMLNVLAAACEERGTDATGIAYNTAKSLQIFKRPLPAHKMRLCIPDNVTCIMGHTRLGTGAPSSRNRNNHPFRGFAGDMPFALAHNGVLSNDDTLRKKHKLPASKIETDSYVAVQLIERAGEVSFASLKKMAETVDGTFTFTVLDRDDNLYIVKGNNPMCLYHWPQLGLFLYASTEEILQKAIAGMHIYLGEPERVKTDTGDILRIDKQGNIQRRGFDTSLLYAPTYYCWPYKHSVWDRAEYVKELKSVAGAFGYSEEDIDLLLAEGFSPEEIEEAFYSFEL